MAHAAPTPSPSSTAGSRVATALPSPVSAPATGGDVHPTSLDPTRLPGWLRAQYPFGSHTHTLPGGLRMHYVDEGHGDETALLLHGNPTWSFLYRNVIPQIRDRYRVIAPDHVGFGLSDKPVEGAYHSLEQHVDNLQHFADALDLRDITLVTQDWGGPIGFGWAVRNPERVRRLVIMNTIAFPPQRERPLTRWHQLLASPLGGVLNRNFNFIVTSAMRFGVEKRLSRNERRAYDYPFPTRASREGPLRLARMVPDKPSHPTAAILREIQENLHKLHDRPCIVAWGERDPVMRAKFIAKWEAVLPGIRRVDRIPDASHFIQEDAPDAVARAIQDVRRLS